ncbi:MAG: Lpg1974 family pore-forming outer membrane protein [Chlamydiota bacterium]
MRIDLFPALVQMASVLSMIITGTIMAEDGLPNPSVRPAPQTKGVEIFAEALYWYTSETVDWADTVVGDNNSFKSDFKTLVFHWAPGFRIGEGYNLNHDGWNTQACYTWFQTKAKDHTQGPVNAGFLAARFSDLEPFSAGKARLILHYNILDCDLGRGFLISKYLYTCGF